MRELTRIRITNLTNPDGNPVLAWQCSGFWHKFQGFMFKESILENEGILLVNQQMSRIQASIHMLFVKFNLAVIWINDLNRIMQVKLVGMGSLIVIPDQPAKYTLETHPSNLHSFSIGDHLRFEKIN